MKIPPQIKPWIKILGLSIGIIADGIMLFACFTSQAPDLMGKIAFGSLGIMIILLIPITYEERALKLWFALVVIAVFFDTSYLLATTREPLPSEMVTVENDQELARLTSQATKAQEILDTKLAEYDRAMKVDTRAQLDGQITDARHDAEAKETARKARYEAIERGEVSGIKITAKSIFEAIPQAIPGRILHLLAYLILAIIIQGMIVFAINEGSARKSFLSRFFAKPAQPREPKPASPPKSKPKRKAVPDTVARWVDANWIKGDRLIDREVFDEFMRGRGGFQPAEYDRIKQAASDAGIIDWDDTIKESDKRKAKEIIRKVLTQSAI